MSPLRVREINDENQASWGWILISVFSDLFENIGGHLIITRGLGFRVYGLGLRGSNSCGKLPKRKKASSAELSLLGPPQWPDLATEGPPPKGHCK